MSPYYLEQPCVLSFNQSCIASHILNLTRGPVPKESKLLQSYLLKNNRLRYHSICLPVHPPNCLYLHFIPLKKFLTHFSFFTISGDHEKGRESCSISFTIAPNRVRVVSHSSRCYVTWLEDRKICSVFALSGQLS